VLLGKLAELARRETPFAFFAQVLGAGGGRQRILARLGPEANDAIDEFLNLALEYERRETPSLHGFLAWLRQARAEVKRDMEIARDEVRVMTVHGAKGLEAPLVILADTMTPPAGPRQPRLLQLPGNIVIWAGRKVDDSLPVAAARQSALVEASDEYRRLLYVAMTRAADRLIICGADTEKKRPDDCWYDLIRRALDSHLVEETEADEKVWRFRKTTPERASPAERDTVKSFERLEFPSWLRQPATLKNLGVVTIAPSSGSAEEPGRAAAGAATGTALDRQKAMQRGQIVHRLMQALPDLPPAARKAALERYLSNPAHRLSPDEPVEIARQVLGILDDARFAEFFAAGSRPEVSIVGRVARPGGEPVLVAGQVDRLRVTADAVLVIDYKTDSPVPSTLDDVPSDYVTQLAFYRAVSTGIYPAKRVRAALLFSAGPNLIEIPGPILDIALKAALERAETQPFHAPVTVA
jgi:ATP-dependent helicase/nuclease subunit A